MNKKTMKIAGWALGLSLAVVGIGTTFATASQKATEVDAATVTTWTRVTSLSTLTSGGTFIMGYEATAKSGTIVPLRSDGAVATTSANGIFRTGTTAGSSTSGTITVTQNASYAAYEVYITASSNTSGAINIQMGSSTGNYYGASSGGSSKNTGRLYTAGNSDETDITVAMDSNNLCSLTSAVSGQYKYMTYNTGSPRYAFYNSTQQKTVFYKKGTQESSTPTLSVSSEAETIKTTASANVTITYANLTSSLGVSSDDESVATVSLANPVASGSGSVVMTISPKGAGTATITVSSTGATSKTVSVTVYEEKEFTKIVSASKVVSGGHYVIAKTGTNTIMSTTQNSNNRGVTTATGSSPYTTLTTTGSDAAVLTITAGTGNYAGYFTLYDPENEGYLYAPTGGNYLRTGTELDDYYYWSINFEDNHALIANKGNDNHTIKNNGSLMATYATAQTSVDLYLLSSEVPADVPLSSITAANASVEVGGVIEFTGSYLPTNATEAIVIETLDDTYATAGSIVMSNGTFTVHITGVAATAGTSLVFEGEDGNGSASVTLTVTSYIPTHDLVTAASGLKNGDRVALGCNATGYDFVAEHSTGSDNLNGIATGFANDKSTLATSADHEFVVWCVNTTNGYYVLSDGNYYLTAPAGEKNFLQRTDVLSDACYFTLTDDADGVILTSKLHDSYTIQFNSSTSRFSLYASSQKSASLYLAKLASDPIQGFVDAFMHMGTYTSNNGYCKDDDHHYYTDAKAAFGQLSADQREDFCTLPAYASAYARLGWWADNNGDKIDENDDYSLVAKANGVFFHNDNNGSSMPMVVTIAALGTAAAAGFFLFQRKRKEF